MQHFSPSPNTPQHPQLPTWWSNLGPEATAQRFAALASVVDVSELQNWMFTPNPRFGGDTPASLLRSGDTASLDELIYRLVSGQPG